MNNSLKGTLFHTAMGRYCTTRCNENKIFVKSGFLATILAEKYYQLLHLKRILLLGTLQFSDILINIFNESCLLKIDCNLGVHLFPIIESFPLKEDYLVSLTVEVRIRKWMLLYGA